MSRRHPKKNGFTLVEVSFTLGILAFCLCGLLFTYINMFVFSDHSRMFSLACNAVGAKIEEVKNCAFDDLFGFYNGVAFDLDGFPAEDSEAVIEVSDVLEYPDLKVVRIVACFKGPDRMIGGRLIKGPLIGEDLNLDGNLDSGEDKDGNGSLDSPVEVVTLIVR